MVIISLGIPGLIQTVQLNDRDIPLYIYGPKGMNDLLVQLLSLGYFKPNYPVISQELDGGDILEFEGYKINVIRANHGVPALAYCLVENMRPGKFDKPKALSLGIPEGPLFSKLQKVKQSALRMVEKLLQMLSLDMSAKEENCFSGDTRPMKEMVEFAKDADVLIHEATFESELEDVAGEYGHTTAAQAAEIAKEANVEKLF